MQKKVKNRPQVQCWLPTTTTTDSMTRMGEQSRTIGDSRCLYNPHKTCVLVCRKAIYSTISILISIQVLTNYKIIISFYLSDHVELI